MDFHEAANIFPLDDESIAALADDIRANGQQVAIEIMDGKVLDGRRRWLACIQAGVKPLTRQVSVADPIAYSWSLNGARRHLTPTQLAMAGAEMRKLYDTAAKERQAAGQKAGGRGNTKNSVENLPPSLESGKARDAVGALVGVSGKSIDSATKVLTQGTPKLIAAAKADKLAVSTASRASSLTPEEQDAIADRAMASNGRRRQRCEDSAEGEQPEGKSRGKGVILANEAINCLTRIPKNDALRKRGFQLVSDWIKANK